MLVILNSLSGNSYTFISLWSAFADLFYPFDWAISPCFLMLPITVLVYVDICKKKNQTNKTAIFLSLGLPCTREDLHQTTCLEILRGPLRLFCECFFSGLEQCRFLLREICLFFWLFFFSQELIISCLR